MKALAVLLALLAESIILLFAPAWAVVTVTLLAATAMPRRNGYVVLVVSTVVINALLLGWLLSDGPGLVRWSWPGAWQGAVGGFRLSALLGVNLATLQYVPPATMLDDVGLGQKATGFLAAVLIAAHDLGRDFQRMRAALWGEGLWPMTRRGRMATVLQMLPGLMVLAQDRAERRREALRLAGVTVGDDFAAVVAVTALAVAGRLALIAIPNVALTFVIVFAAGIALGTRIAVWGAFWSMLLTDLMLTGLHWPSFVNVPAMMMIGAFGGLLRGVAWHREDAWTIRLVAGTIGVVGTFAFSVATDALGWFVIAEYRDSIERFQIGILAGLAFNVVPAIVNGVLFGATVAPVARAFRARQATTARSRTPARQPA